MRRHRPRRPGLARSCKRASLALAAALAVSSPARAAPQTFAELEARLSDALAAYDRAQVDQLWDDDLIFLFPDGKLSRKAERLAAQVPPPGDGGPRLVAHNDAVDVDYEDDHVAVVVVHSSWRFGDGPPQPFVATHVWIRRAQGWRLLSAQVAAVKSRP